MAEQHRKVSLLRALDSARAASSDHVQFVVVVNGHRRSLEVTNSLETMSDVIIISLKDGSLPHALIAGRAAVTTPFFCCLDDDDELLPGSIDIRLNPMLADSRIDLVTGNGYGCIAGSDSVAYKHLDSVFKDPLRAIFVGNWLASCSALFRSDSIDVSYFENFHPHIEWTWLAFNLAMHKKNIAVVDKPTFRVHDTVGSASKSHQYRQAHLNLYERMLISQPPDDVRQLILSRIGGILHMEADDLWRAHRLFPAWIVHLRSLTYPGGLRYLTFSRHLIWIPKRRNQ